MHPIYLMPWCWKQSIQGHQRVNYSIPGWYCTPTPVGGGGLGYSVPCWSCTPSTPGGKNLFCTWLEFYSQYSWRWGPTLYLVGVVLPVLQEGDLFCTWLELYSQFSRRGGPILYLVGVVLPVLLEVGTYSVPGWSCTPSTSGGENLLCTWLELYSQYSWRELNYEPFFLHHPEIKITKVK